jgi:hypothetical protein
MTKTGNLDMKKSPSLASVANPIYERVHIAMHNLWSKSVGQPGYVKSEWTELEQAVQSLAQEADKRSRVAQSSDTIGV